MPLLPEVLAVLAGERTWAVQCGDALELLPLLPAGCVDAVLTDPVWPNATAPLAGREDPAGLFAAAAAHFPRLAKRLVVQLGCDSDPRFLLGVPAALPFFRACWLSYAVPSFKGRVLYIADVAYAFGEPPPSKKGARVIPGRCQSDGSFGKTPGHPCPRNPHHVRWLVRWFARGPVLDPFCGIATAGEACLRLGLPFVGFEIDPGYCETARRRLERAAREQREMLFPAAGLTPAPRQADFTEGS